MEIHAPDSAYTSSQRAHANYRIAVRITLGFAALLWLIQLSGWALDVGPGDFGVRPRQWAGFVGILFAPLMHDGFAHLLANTPPLIVLGVAMLYLYPAASPRVLPAIWLGPGAAVWLLGTAGTIHIGASGLVYGLLAYVFVAGLLRRDRRAIATSMLVCFMYGALVWGVLPIRTRVSWETHLAAALIGVALALLLRRLDVPPRKRYTWEDEPAEPGGSDDGQPWGESSTLPLDTTEAGGRRILH